MLLEFLSEWKYANILNFENTDGNPLSKSPILEMEL